MLNTTGAATLTMSNQNSQPLYWQTTTAGNATISPPATEVSIGKDYTPNWRFNPRHNTLENLFSFLDCTDFLRVEIRDKGTIKKSPALFKHNVEQLANETNIFRVDSANWFGIFGNDPAQREPDMDNFVLFLEWKNSENNTVGVDFTSREIVAGRFTNGVFILLDKKEREYVLSGFFSQPLKDQSLADYNISTQPQLNGAINLDTLRKMINEVLGAMHLPVSTGQNGLLGIAPQPLGISPQYLTGANITGANTTGANTTGTTSTP